MSTLARPCLLLLLAVLMTGAAVAQAQQQEDFPGAPHLHPSIHFTPSWVSMKGGWHDVAGALTHNGVHHVFQGTGWNHAMSTDLVHWGAAPHGPKALHETYAGMDSNTDPCSGFMTKDDDGTICAGFRQCGSNKGVSGAAHAWDVPLELRCATDQQNLTAFVEDESSDLWSHLFNVSFWRGIPYDPARPWHDAESGMWFQLLSMDACNATDAPRNVGGKTCSLGGQLVMWASPKLRGPGADWKLVGPVWTDNTTVLRDGFLSHEFVTIDMLGTMPGDPDPAHNTFVFLNNVGGNGGGDGCCSGTTSYTTLQQPRGPGTAFVKVGPGQMMVDWGSFTFKAEERSTTTTTTSSSSSSPLDALTGTASRGLSMARTLGSEEADQVTKPGRRVLIGWTGPADVAAYGGQGSAQSLPRDLSLAQDRTLLQRFVPELQVLRQKHTQVTDAAALARGVPAGLQAEVRAFFPSSSCGGAGSGSGSCKLLLLGEEASGHATAANGASGGVVEVQLLSDKGLVAVDATSLGNTRVRAGPLPDADPETKGWTVHAIVDHAIVELIVNNRTAFVVYAAPSNTSTGTVAAHVPVLPAGGNSHNKNTRKARLDVWTLANANNM